MIGRFARDGILYGGAFAVSRAVAFVLLPVYTRVLTPDDFGVLDLLLAFAAFAYVTVCLEVAQGLARHLPEATDDASRTSYVSTSLAFAAIAYGAFAIAVVVLAPVIASAFMEREDGATLLALTAIAISAVGVFQLAQSQLRFLMRPRAYAFSSVTFAVVSGSVAVCLVVWADAGVAGVLVGQLAGGVAGLAVALHRMTRYVARRIDRERLGEMLAFSLPLVPSSVAVIVASYVDRVAIASLLSVGDVGLYGVGFRIASLASLLLVGFQTALTPLIYLHYGDSSTPSELARLFRYFVAATAIVTLSLVAFSPELVAFLGGPDFAGSEPVVAVLGLSMLIAGMYNFAPGLAIAKRTRAIAAISITGAVAVTVLNIVLIPALGIVGAALASLAGMSIVFAAYLVLGQRLYPVPHRPGPLVVVATVTIVVVLVAAGPVTVGDSGLVARLILPIGALGLVLASGLVTAAEVGGVLDLSRRARTRLER